VPQAVARSDPRIACVYPSLPPSCGMAEDSGLLRRRQVRQTTVTPVTECSGEPSPAMATAPPGAGVGIRKSQSLTDLPRVIGEEDSVVLLPHAQALRRSNSFGSLIRDQASRVVPPSTARGRSAGDHTFAVPGAAGGGASSGDSARVAAPPAENEAGSQEVDEEDDDDDDDDDYVLPPVRSSRRTAAPPGRQTAGAVTSDAATMSRLCGATRLSLLHQHLGSSADSVEQANAAVWDELADPASDATSGLWVGPFAEALHHEVANVLGQAAASTNQAEREELLADLYVHKHWVPGCARATQGDFFCAEAGL